MLLSKKSIKRESTLTVVGLIDNCKLSLNIKQEKQEYSPTISTLLILLRHVFVATTFPKTIVTD